MKTLAQSLPPGLSPEPTPAQAGPSPAPGADRKPAPGVCEFCAEHWPEVGGQHYRVSEQGSAPLGPCTAPRAILDSKPEPKPKQRSHEECMEELRAKANTSAAASVLTNPGRGSAAAHGMPREPGCDDD